MHSVQVQNSSQPITVSVLFKSAKFKVPFETLLTASPCKIKTKVQVTYSQHTVPVYIAIPKGGKGNTVRKSWTQARLKPAGQTPNPASPCLISKEARHALNHRSL